VTSTVVLSVALIVIFPRYHLAGFMVGFYSSHHGHFQLMGGKPENTGSIGDVEKVAKVFVRNELMPLESRFLKLNEWAGEEIIRFQKYSFDTDDE